MHHHPPEPSTRPLLIVGAAGLATALGIAMLLQRNFRGADDANVRGVQGLGAGAAILCLSVALDSGIEHYRARFHDPLMLAGPTAAVAGLAAATAIAFRPERANASGVKLTLAVTAAAGAVGLGFHGYNILKRPWGLSDLNLFYAAPAGAPAALTLAGGLGLLAGQISSSGTAQSRKDLARVGAATAVVGLLGTAAEAGLLHFRGAFQNPVMYAPVTLPPAAAIATGAAILWSRSAPVAEPLLKATAVLGIAGPLFHAYGVHRNMGGWRNWSQMVLQGPPIPAPPAFLGLAIGALGMLPLLHEERT